VVKPSGMPSHTGPGHDENTLVNALLAKFGDLSVIGGGRKTGHCALGLIYILMGLW